MAEPLPLQAVIGFGGQVENGLVVAPDGTLIYPLGSTIVLRSKKDAKHQEFLQGHTDKVTNWEATGVCLQLGALLCLPTDNNMSHAPRRSPALRCPGRAGSWRPARSRSWASRPTSLSGTWRRSRCCTAAPCTRCGRGIRGALRRSRCKSSGFPTTFCVLQRSQVKIQALAFSPNERFLASLGGPDDNNLVGTPTTNLPSA